MKIKKIKKIKCDGKNVYDLEVVKYHNFLIDKGIVVHNCRYLASEFILGNMWQIGNRKLI